MQDKRTLILETALRLFSEKGFHQTSMQDIADAAGIAKGSTYMHFKSKSELLVNAYKFLYEQLKEEFDLLGKKYEADPRRLLKEITISQLEVVNRYGPLIMMQMTEQVAVDNKEMHEMVIRLHLDSIEWTRNLMLAIYGEEAAPYAFDCTALYQALLKHYFSYLLINGIQLDGDRLSKLILAHLDLSMEGFRQGRLEPVVPEGAERLMWEEFGGKLESMTPKCSVMRQLQRLQELVSKWNGSAADKAEIETSLAAIEEEMGKEEPRLSVIRGMAAYMAGFDVQEFKEPLKTLQASCAEWAKLLQSQGPVQG